MWICFIAGENCEVPIQQARVEQLLLEWKPLKHSDSRESLRRLISRKKRFLSLAVYTNALPLSNRTGGHHCYVSASGEIPLLLVVYRNRFELLALRIGSARSNGAGFAIGRHGNSSGDSNPSAFLDG